MNAWHQIDKHMDNIQAMFIEQNKRIAELEKGVREILEKAETLGYDGGHAGIETICVKLLRK